MVPHNRNRLYVHWSIDISILVPMNSDEPQGWPINRMPSFLNREKEGRKVQNLFSKAATSRGMARR